MNKGLYFVAFVVGAGVGGFATWQYTKKKYEQIAQEEIDSVKEVFAQREKELKEKTDELNKVKKAVAAEAKEKPNLSEYAARNASLGYTTSLNTSPETSYTPPKDGPYIITPDEFGEFDDYQKFSLIYYADKFLADDNDDLVDNVDEIIGWESLEHFGEYEEDSVFVRNDALKCDYEILLSLNNYKNIKRRREPKPHEVED